MGWVQGRLHQPRSGSKLFGTGEDAHARPPPRSRICCPRPPRPCWRARGRCARKPTPAASCALSCRSRRAAAPTPSRGWSQSSCRKSGARSRDREQGRRRNLDRHRRRREGRARRPYDTAAIGAACGQQVPVRVTAVRSGGRSRADQPVLRLPQHHGGADVFAGAFGAGVHRLRQGQSRQGHLCVVRLWHLGASVRRAVQAAWPASSCATSPIAARGPPSTT